MKVRKEWWYVIALCFLILLVVTIFRNKINFSPTEPQCGCLVSLGTPTGFYYPWSVNDGYVPGTIFGVMPHLYPITQYSSISGCSYTADECNIDEECSVRLTRASYKELISDITLKGHCYAK